MECKFEGFEGCFQMTVNATKSETLQSLGNAKYRRKQLNVKIEKEAVSLFEMMDELKSDLQKLDTLLKHADEKMKAKECCAVINKVVAVLTKRINDLWNTILLLFSTNDGLDPEFIVPTDANKIFRCIDCYSCKVPYESIMNRMKIITTPEGMIFNFSSSDFIKILQTTTFVDKTLMIKELFRNKETQRLVITAPRKYGKSTNLSMLKYFLEMQVDSHGKPLTKAKAVEPITDTSNYELFKELKISKEANIMKDHLGKYPVLYANFKIGKNINSYAIIIEGYKTMIHKAFQSHNYLQKSSKLCLEQKKICKLWCGEASYRTISNINNICTALTSLCKCLKKHYNMPCFVLIDEPDYLTMILSVTDTELQFYKDISSFLSQCLLFLSNEELVVGAFVTGKSMFAIRGLVPSYCIEIHPFTEFHEFTDYYGLTINELEYLFKIPECKGVTITIEEVKAYYGSYNKVDQITKTKKEIYCMWSILNFLKSKRLDNYWRDFGKIFCNFSNPTIKEKMQQLLINESNLGLLHDTKKPKSYPALPPIITSSETLTGKSLNFFFHNLLDLGYLTHFSFAVEGLEFHNNSHSCIYVTIPNKEVEQDIKNKMSLLS